MHYLLSAIHDSAGLATSTELAAIDNRGEEAVLMVGRSWSRRSSSPAEEKTACGRIDSCRMLSFPQPARNSFDSTNGPSMSTASSPRLSMAAISVEVAKPAESWITVLWVRRNRWCGTSSSSSNTVDP